MARRFQRLGELEAGVKSEIDISPLIDVVFILLIFFIVTTVFVDETGIEVNKPRAATQQDLERNSILIGVTRTGQVFYVWFSVFNLFVTMLQRLGVETDRFSSSTGTLSGLAGV